MGFQHIQIMRQVWFRKKILRNFLVLEDFLYIYKKNEYHNFRRA